MRLLPVKTTLAIATLGMLLTLPDAVPSLKKYKSLDWGTVPTVWDFQPHGKSAQPVAEEEQRLRPSTDVSKTAIYPVVDSNGQLDHFYEALQRAERGQGDGVVRILHYGDSPTTADLITADTRALLQKRFGDAGHGYCLIAKPWAWYGHRGLELSASGWSIDPATQSTGRRDGLYGLGGVSFLGEAGAVAHLQLQESGHQKIEVAYLQQPGGGEFSVWADGREIGRSETTGETEPGFAPFTIPAGARKFEIRVERGPVRLFGVQFTKNGPGVVYNSLGLNGAYVSVLARFFEPKHWAAELQHYRPDLVIVNYGTNESMYATFVDKMYQTEMREIIRRIRVGAPDASLLVMSPMDRGERDAQGEIGTVPALQRLVGLQQRVAQESDCGFFNTFQAMGGPGTMGRWYAAEPRLVGSDFIHPMPSGAKLVGNLLYRALLDGYNKYKLRHMQEKFARIEKKS